jgi:hypothetical protein
MGTWFSRLPPSSERLRLIIREAAARLRGERVRGKGRRESGVREDGARERRAGGNGDREREVRGNGVREPWRPPAVRVTERTAVRLHRAAAGLVEVTSEVNAYAELLEEKAHELRTRVRDRERAPVPPAPGAVSAEFSTGRSGWPPDDGKLPSRRHPI